jgi:hypothetical protein
LDFKKQEEDNQRKNAVNMDGKSNDDTRQKSNGEKSADNLKPIELEEKEVLKAIIDKSGLECNSCNLNMTKTVKGWLDCTQVKKFDRKGGIYPIDDEKAPLTHIIGQCFSISELMQLCNPDRDSRFLQLSNVTPTAILFAHAIDPSLTYYLQSVFSGHYSFLLSWSCLLVDPILTYQWVYKTCILQY